MFIVLLAASLLLVIIGAVVFFVAEGDGTAYSAATVACVAFVGGLVIAGSSCHGGHSGGDGVSVGTIVNVARTGVWWNVDEVYVLHRGEMKAEKFGIEPGLVETARRFADTGERVRVHYQSFLVCGAWNYADCDVIDRIELDDAQGSGARP
jgi:hypothetical protein